MTRPPLPARLFNRYLAGELAAAVLLSAICWYFGASVLHAILLGCGIALVAVAVVVATDAEVHDSSWRGKDRVRARGSRSDVSSLSLRIRGSRGRVDYAVQRRVRELARHRLAIYGLDLQNADHRAQIEQLIGVPAYDFLLRTHKNAPPLRALLACLDALDGLDPNHYRTPQPDSYSRFPFLSLLRSRTSRDR